MRHLKITCDECGVEVPFEKHMTSFAFPTPLTNGRKADGLLCLDDRCPECAKPIYEALRRLHNKYASWTAPKAGLK